MPSQSAGRFDNSILTTSKPNAAAGENIGVGFQQMCSLGFVACRTRQETDHCVALTFALVAIRLSRYACFRKNSQQRHPATRSAESISIHLHPRWMNLCRSGITAGIGSGLLLTWLPPPRAESGFIWRRRPSIVPALFLRGCTRGKGSNNFALNITAMRSESARISYLIQRTMTSIMIPPQRSANVNADE